MPLHTPPFLLHPPAGACPKCSKGSKGSRRIQCRQRGTRQQGVATVEFALVAVIFFSLLLGTMEFGRWMFTLNAASEATRLGARLAVVCSQADAAQIRQRMSALTLSITPEQMAIDYLPAGCDASSCQTVTARVTGATFRPVVPLWGTTYAIPPFAVSLPRERMSSNSNPVCPGTI